MTTKYNENAGDSMLIPRWFLVLLSGFVALFIPWASWVTLTLATISVRVEAHSEVRSRLEKLEERITMQAGHCITHAAEITALSTRVNRLETAARESRP